jgi:hypothetical protein
MPLNSAIPLELLNWPSVWMSKTEPGDREAATRRWDRDLGDHPACGDPAKPGPGHAFGKVEFAVGSGCDRLRAAILGRQRELGDEPLGGDSAESRTR